MFCCVSERDGCGDGAGLSDSVDVEGKGEEDGAGAIGLCCWVGVPIIANGLLDPYPVG